MKKLDKQFEQMIKGVRIDSPSSDFTLKVMSRVQAEAAVRKRSLLEDYQPVISRRTWIILIAAFVLLTIYITISGKTQSPSSDQGIWSAIPDALSKLNTSRVSTIWQTGLGIFTTIPPIAYLILTASLGLWTLDSFLSRFRNNSSKIRLN